MGIMTISVPDEVEKKFRERVSQVYGKKKGVLGQAIAQAMEEWTAKRDSVHKALELLDRGLDLGGTTYKTRSELHDRN